MPRRKDQLELIGVRFDGSGRPRGQADAAPTLREVGLVETLPDATSAPDVVTSAPDPARGRGGFANEVALLQMIEEVRSRVAGSWSAQRFPVVYGADCAVLLGAVPALREEQGRVGLLFLDAHEDATSTEHSPDGEAANMEIALLLGATGEHAPDVLRRWLPAIDTESVVMIGQRDQRFRESIGVPSIAPLVRVHHEQTVHGRAADVADESVEHLERVTSGWWLHIDLDVLRGDDFPACAAASDPTMPGGLTWAELTAISSRALQSSSCRGFSVGVYNTDLDPDRQAARRIVQFLGELLSTSD